MFIGRFHLLACVSVCVCKYSKYANSKHVFFSFKDKHLLFSLLPIVVSHAGSDGARRALDVR